ncbi:acyltransferase [Mitsuaria sp. GD03876]|uniref:acyltransferase n=1 Tax=Mitsuaria sp. GD03876 TaxID=2975399 RepID=UPI00244A2655|nr:acyltransferase [Mitsuaria sp. GD03876]MDH0866544.1 acyltransferase [Mitsuaria sp. GD03876]
MPVVDFSGTYLAWPAIALIAMAVNAAWLRFGGEHVADSRYPTIDGLRGYLALAVFIQHAELWWSMTQRGTWAVDPSPAKSLGAIAVSMFFMVTAFLFVGKLLDARASGRPVAWDEFFDARLRRLVPMYLVAVSFVVLICGFLSGWTLRVRPGELARQLGAWATFTFAGQPDINGVADTGRILAGVTWSLTYEWLFYLLLPAAAWAMRLRPPPWALAVSLCVPLLIVTSVWQPHLAQSKPFLGGIVAAVLVRVPAWRRIAATPLASVAAIAAVVLALVDGDSGYADRPLCAATLAFCLIAAGTSLFGALTAPLSRSFGEPTYSMYLLQGLLLYLAFAWRVPVADADAAPIGRVAYWGIVCGLTVVLVAITRLTYQVIERPAMSHRKAAARPAATTPMPNAIAAP